MYFAFGMMKACTNFRASFHWGLCLLAWCQVPADPRYQKGLISSTSTAKMNHTLMTEVPESYVRGVGCGFAGGMYRAS